MDQLRNLIAVAALALGAFVSGAGARAADVEDIVAQHMVAEALLAAHLIAIPEKAGMSPEAIKAILTDVAAKSAIDEFWITDQSGRAYLTNQDVEFHVRE